MYIKINIPLEIGLFMNYFNIFYDNLGFFTDLLYFEDQYT